MSTSTYSPRALRDLPKQDRSVQLIDLRGFAKSATLGGEQETQFERSFASLAYSYVQDKAPKLLDYMLGFQLVDRNEDCTKAVGAFGFQIDKQLVLTPVFFLSGDMKGHELMYLKNQDMFVPLKENWVNFILRKKPQVLGQGTRQTIQDMGVMQPNASQVILPPFANSKYSSFLKSAADWVHNQGVFPTLAGLAFELDIAGDADAYFGKEASVPETNFLKRALEKDYRYAKAAEALFDRWPGVKAAFEVHYGVKFLPDCLARHSEQVKQAASTLNPVLRKRLPGAKQANTGSVLSKRAAAAEPAAPKVDKTVVITQNSPLFTDSEREKLLREGQLIKDTRDGEEFTRKYNTQISMTLTNPTATGIYDVLLNTGDFKKCLVIVAPYSESGRSNYATLVQLEGDNKAHSNLPLKQVFIRQNSGDGENASEGVLDWFKELPAGTKTISSDGLYVAVSPNGDGTVVFEAGDSNGDNSRSVYTKTYCPQDEAPGYGCNGPYLPSHGPSVITGVRKGQTFLAHKQQLYIPEGAKIIELAGPRKCRECGKTRDNCTCDYFHSPREDRDVKIQPGGPDDLQLSLTKKTAELKIHNDHCDVIMEGQRLSKRAALVSLVTRHGLSEQDAREFLKEAELNDTVRWRLQYADGYPRSKQAAGFGGFPEPSEGGSTYTVNPAIMSDPYMGSDMPYVGAAMQQPTEQTVQIPGLESGMNDPNIYNPLMVQDPMQMQMAQRAADPNQKEVLDTSVMSALTKVVNPDNVVDDDLKDYAKALNKLGRRLFMFYWHNDDFQERYGKKELPELEDTLRNAFEILGDLFLFLQQKNINMMFGTEMSNIGPNIQNASR